VAVAAASHDRLLVDTLVGSLGGRLLHLERGREVSC
jgi:hypothetical protein